MRSIQCLSIFKDLIGLLFAKIGPIFLAMTIFASPPTLAAVNPCLALVKKVLPERRLNDEGILKLQTDADLQFTTRDLGEYLSALKIAPVLYQGSLNPDFHWVDVGGGAGVAVLQSFIRENYNSTGYRYPGEIYTSQITAHHQATVVSYEDLYFKHLLHQDEDVNMRRQRWRPKLMEIHDRQISKGRLKYISGHFFEDLEQGEVGQADLITDLFGAFSYSKNKFDILRKMISLLKPGGTIVIWTIWPKIKILSETSDLTEVNLKQYLEMVAAPGITSLEGNGIKINPTAETLDFLNQLESQIELEKVIKDMPPLFYYNLLPSP